MLHNKTTEAEFIEHFLLTRSVLSLTLVGLFQLISCEFPLEVKAPEAHVSEHGLHLCYLSSQILLIGHLGLILCSPVHLQYNVWAHTEKSVECGKCNKTRLFFKYLFYFVTLPPCTSPMMRLMNPSRSWALVCVELVLSSKASPFFCVTEA